MPKSGQITVTTAGTAVRGPDVPGSIFAFSAHPANNGEPVWLGNDGNNDVSSATGFPLAKSTTISKRSAGEILSWVTATGAGRKPPSDAMT